MSRQNLGLYVQIPFCASKCSFCNFSSQVRPASVFSSYCSALESEARHLPAHLSNIGVAARISSLPVDSVYFGGGTPSLLGGQRVRHLVDVLKSVFICKANCEFTVEITPGSADDALLAQMAECGVNRLSVGAQSFNDRELAVVGRLHSANETAEQIRRARKAGIAQINVDLIAGLPYQTEESWRASLDGALALNPAHVSVYIFEADEKSRLGHEVRDGGKRYHAASLPDEEFMSSAYEEARRRLCDSGYAHYEISNFALPGFESRHNLKYWNLDPYLGLGAGAHSFDGLRRWWNVENVEVYEDRVSNMESPIEEKQLLDETQRIEEFFFLGLRQLGGVSLRDALERWGERRLGPWQAKIEALMESGWLEWKGERICLADRALLVSNEIFQEFVEA